MHVKTNFFLNIFFYFTFKIASLIFVYGFPTFLFFKAIMPSGVGGSYRSLADDVYKSTTVAENKFSVIESVKRAFNFAAPGTGRSDPLILRNDNHPQPTVVPAR